MICVVLSFVMQTMMSEGELLKRGIMRPPPPLVWLGAAGENRGYGGRCDVEGVGPCYALKFMNQNF